MRMNLEFMYPAIAGPIEAARKAGMQDEDIHRAIQGRMKEAMDAGISAEDITKYLQPAPQAEPAKAVMRGLAKGLTLGFYVPDALATKKNEPETMGDIWSEAGGEFAGAIAPFMGAFAATGPAGAMATRMLPAMAKPAITAGRFYTAGTAVSGARAAGEATRTQGIREAPGAFMQGAKEAATDPYNIAASALGGALTPLIALKKAQAARRAAPPEPPPSQVAGPAPEPTPPAQPWVPETASELQARLEPATPPARTELTPEQQAGQRLGEQTGVLQPEIPHEAQTRTEQYRTDLHGSERARNINSILEGISQGEPRAEHLAMVEESLRHDGFTDQVATRLATELLDEGYRRYRAGERGGQSIPLDAEERAGDSMAARAVRTVEEGGQVPRREVIPPSEISTDFERIQLLTRRIRDRVLRGDENIPEIYLREAREAGLDPDMIISNSRRMRAEGQTVVNPTVAEEASTQEPPRSTAGPAREPDQILDRGGRPIADLPRDQWEGRPEPISREEMARLEAPRPLTMQERVSQTIQDLPELAGREREVARWLRAEGPRAAQEASRAGFNIVRQGEDIHLERRDWNQPRRGETPPPAARPAGEPPAGERQPPVVPPEVPPAEGPSSDLTPGMQRQLVVRIPGMNPIVVGENTGPETLRPPTWTRADPAFQAWVQELEQMMPEGTQVTVQDVPAERGQTGNVRGAPANVESRPRTLSEAQADQTPVSEETLRALERRVQIEGGEVPSGLTPSRAAGRARRRDVRLPEEQFPSQAVSLSTLRALAERKGVSVGEIAQGRTDIVLDGGQVQSFPNMVDAARALFRMPDITRPASIHEPETRASDPLPIDTDPTRNAVPPEPAEVPPPPPDPIGGAGAQLAAPQRLQHIAQARELGPTEANRLAMAVTQAIQRNPGIEQDLFRHLEHANPVSWSPLDVVGQPQFVRDPFLRHVFREGARIELAHDLEYKNWMKLFNQHIAGLTPEQDRLAWRMVEGRATPQERAGASPAVQGAVDFWQRGAADFAQRFQIPEWSSYVTHLIDMNKLYRDTWRPAILDYRDFDAVPESLQIRLGSEEAFKLLQRAFRKNEAFDNLPREAKRIFRQSLLNWGDQSARYGSLPEFIRSRIPEEIFDRFLLPRTGGLPVQESLKNSFLSYLPVAINKLHYDPFLDRWQPIISNMPGQNIPASARHYSERWLLNFINKDSGTVNRTGDMIIGSVENLWGKKLADPNFVSRLSGNVRGNVYRAFLGLDSAMINLTQIFAAAGATGKVARGLFRGLVSGAEDFRAMPEGIGLLHEFARFTTEGGGTEGIGPEKFRKFDQALTRISLSPMNVTENILRGWTLLSGLEEAAQMGLDHQQAIQMGLARASRVVPNLALTEAQVHAMERVAQTQFGYSKAASSPYLRGPFFTMSTMFWSYPTKLGQMLSNMAADGTLNTWRDPSIGNMGVLLRYLATIGLFVGGGVGLQQLGIDATNVFGVKGLLPQGMSPPLQLASNAYSMAVSDRQMNRAEIDRAWLTAWGVAGVPQVRYGRKLVDVAESLQRGYRLTPDGVGQSFQTTPLGEFTRAFGFDSGPAVNQKLVAKRILKLEFDRRMERENALAEFLNSDGQKFARIEEYNKRWPEPISADDIANAARLRATPLVERTGTIPIRIQAREEYGYQPR